MAPRPAPRAPRGRQPVPTARATSPLMIGIAGGTASGKTTVARRIIDALPGATASLIDLDSYYKELSHLHFEQRVQQNFDHPDAFDFDLLIEHLRTLRHGGEIRKPVYSFDKHTRLDASTTIRPGRVIIVEGILVLALPALREQFDVKIYVDTDDDVRLLRRLTRDIKERGRSFDGVAKQYFETVRPMHLSFIEPTKRFADIVIPHGGNNEAAIGMVVAAIRGKLEGH